MVSRSMEVLLATTHFSDRLHYRNMVGKMRRISQKCMDV